MSNVNVRSDWGAIVAFCPSVFMNRVRVVSRAERLNDCMWAPGGRHVRNGNMTFQGAVGERVAVESERMLDRVVVKVLSCSGDIYVGSVDSG